MSRFFHDIQGYFDTLKKRTYSGRYLAIILAELFRRDPGAFTRVLNEAGINYTRNDFEKLTTSSLLLLQRWLHWHWHHWHSRKAVITLSRYFADSIVAPLSIVALTR